MQDSVQRKAFVNRLFHENSHSEMDSNFFLKQAVLMELTHIYLRLSNSRNSGDLVEVQKSDKVFAERVDQIHQTVDQGRPLSFGIGI